ncbi:MAG: phosphoribosylformylglycinamidine synthase subunit PurS [Candidatus Aminicenantes bacterium]|nr:MAG: phosphoribosylformylglycinamidine synthase subunit PurS [Candidatus Aminicenantes bacterium]
MKIRILVSYKDGVLDPQGQTVKHALHTLGYDFIKDVRQGKVFEIALEGISQEEAEKVVPEISDKVLANPIIEKFSWQILQKE